MSSILELARTTTERTPSPKLGIPSSLNNVHPSPVHIIISGSSIRHNISSQDRSAHPRRQFRQPPLSLLLTVSSRDIMPSSSSLPTSTSQSLRSLRLPQDSLAYLQSESEAWLSTEPLRLVKETLICSPSRQLPQLSCEQFQHSNVYSTWTWQMCWSLRNTKKDQQGWKRKLYVGNGKGLVHTHVHRRIICGNESSFSVSHLLLLLHRSQLSFDGGEGVLRPGCGS